MKVEAERHGKQLRYKILVAGGESRVEADLINKRGWIPLNDLGRYSVLCYAIDNFTLFTTKSCSGILNHIGAKVA